jgi:hypothetical protein
MKTRPILFNGEMVRAILAGKKTQTRRPVKMPKGANLIAWITVMQRAEELDLRTGCPFGTAGDRMWVRETFSLTRPPFPDESEEPIVKYAADDGAHPLQHWTPSIHMPRWASRITLEIVSVRLERVSKISDADAIAEGFETRAHFVNTWVNIYGAESLNQWAWVVTFELVAP